MIATPIRTLVFQNAPDKKTYWEDEANAFGQPLQVKQNVTGVFHNIDISQTSGEIVTHMTTTTKIVTL